MTRLQKKRRTQSAQKFYHSGRNKAAAATTAGDNSYSYNKNNRSNNTNAYDYDNTPIKVWSGHPIANFKMATKRQGRKQEGAHIPVNDPIIVDKRTEQAMKVELGDFLHDKGGSCSLMEAASALAGSSRVIDMYANQNNHKHPTSGLFQSIKNWVGKTIFRNRDGVMHKYHIIGALKHFETRPNSSTTRVDSWEQMQEILSPAFVFPERDTSLVNEFNQKLLMVDPNATASATATATPHRKQHLDHHGSNDYYFMEERSLTPSHERWREVKLPERDLKKEEEERRFAEEQRLAKQREEEARQAEQQRRAEEARREAEEQERLRLEQERAEEARQFASSLLRDFSDEEEAIIHDEIYGDGPEEEVMHSLGPDSVQRGSLNRLKPCTYLNDEVIHYFYVMLGKRDEELCQRDPNRKRSHFFKSFFMTKLLNEGHTDPSKDGEYEYRNVKRWSKKAPGKDLFNLDKVFFPINIDNAHWICAVAFMQQKKIRIYDSLGGGGKEYLESIFRYLKDEHVDKKKCPLPDQDQWELIGCTADTPRQANGYDCGVFTCMFADFVSKDCPVLFEQEHITLCRKRIALSISQGKAIL